MSRENWTERELELIVADYFAMLSLELTGQTYNKAEHGRTLLPFLPGRSHKSLEFKHCNISSVLYRMGLPYIEGYRPLSNVQKLLESAVPNYVIANHEIVAQIAEHAGAAPRILFNAPMSFSAVLADASPPHGAGDAVWPPLPSPANVDFVSRDARNRELGQLGERWALALEKRRLIDEGTPDLAEYVEWVAETQGDGLGFDILSREANGEERLIEVKTTNLHASFPFLVSRNEVAVSRRYQEQYHLYRIFHFRRRARLFVLDGPLDRVCELDALQYRARAAR